MTDDLLIILYHLFQDVGPMFFISLNKPMVFSVNLSLSGTTQDTAVLPILSHTAPVSHINNVCINVGS